MSYAAKTEPDHDLTGYPKGVPYIIGNEGCERFSFYGMKAILYVYIIGLYLQINGVDYATASREATAATHFFVAGVYFVPLIGGILADRLLGKYMTIMSLSVVYCLGHLALAIFENASWQESMFGQVFVNPIDGLFIGLFLICLGSGGIKPCVSAHVGDQFGKKNWDKLEKIFNAFYFIINFGSTFATLIIPVIRGNLIWKVGETVGPIQELETTLNMTVEQIQNTGTFMGYDGSVGLAFGIPGILMGLATIAFWMGRKVFIHVPAKPGGKLGLFDALSGSSLFMVIAWPIFFKDYSGGLASPITWGISLVSLIAFIILFKARQNMEQDDGFLAIMFYAISASLKGEGKNIQVTEDPYDLEGSSFWGPAAKKFGVEATEGPVAVLKIISVFIMVSVFWALFDQHSSTWIAQASAMSLEVQFTQIGWLMLGASLGALVGGAFYLSLSSSPLRVPITAGCLVAGLATGYFFHMGTPEVGHYKLLPSQIPSSNPIMVMILIPYTTFGLYPLLKKLGWDPQPLRRMTLGMFMAAASFAVVALIQRAIDSGAATGDKVHVAWQLIPYGVITLSEVMVSITGLEFAYSQAPKRMKSVIMGFWLFNVTLGSLLVVLLAGFEDLSPENFFWVFTGLMALAATIFGIRAKFYRYQDYTQ